MYVYILCIYIYIICMYACMYVCIFLTPTGIVRAPHFCHALLSKNTRLLHKITCTATSVSRLVE